MMNGNNSKPRTWTYTDVLGMVNAVRSIAVQESFPNVVTKQKHVAHLNIQRVVEVCQLWTFEMDF